MIKKYSILYVDDENSNLNIFKNTFRRTYTIFTAQNAFEGLAILEKEAIDLILTDQRMPEMTGVDFLRKVVNLYPDPYRILVTGYTDFDALKSAVNEAKIFQYIQKPWDEEYLQKVIDEALDIYTLKYKNQELTQELKERNNELDKRNIELVELDRLKNVFLQNISHEIRTPLNAIIGFADIIPEYYNNKEHITHYAGIIHDRGYELLDLMNNMMKVSLLETHQIKVNNASFNIMKCINEVKDYCIAYKLKHKKSEVEFKTEINIPPEFENITADHDKVSTIIYNLINNAFKYTFKGEIIASFSITDLQNLVIEVRDTGIGIPEHKQAEIFERFVQIESDDLNEGVGLGLSIVKGYIELMGGSIDISSGTGKGSRFTAVIPFKK
jgi:signal transduction histidine kinase